MSTREKEFQIIKDMLDGARKYNLDVEVVWTALNEMKVDHTLSIKDACYRAFYEWIK